MHRGGKELAPASSEGCPRPPHRHDHTDELMLGAYWHHSCGGLLDGVMESDLRSDEFLPVPLFRGTLRRRRVAVLVTRWSRSVQTLMWSYAHAV